MRPVLRGPAVPAVLLLAVAAGLTVHNLADLLPPSEWWQAATAPAADDVRHIVLQASRLPRLLLAVLCGAVLAVAGALFQQVLRNPLASPTTLGVAAGAHLALGVATLAAPGLLVAVGRGGVAFAGGAAALAVVLFLTWRTALSPLAVVLAGMIVSLYAGALGVILVLFNQHYLSGLFIWGGGSLSQQGWDALAALAPLCALALLPLPLVMRPLTILELEDEGARSLGVPVAAIRLAALGLGVVLTALVVGAVGVIGFVGLAAPAFARLAGARRFAARVGWAAVYGAALLWLTDQAVQAAAGPFSELIPTGAVTALFGSPLLLWLLPRLRGAMAPPRAAAVTVLRRAGHPVAVAAALAAAVAVAAAVSLGVGRGLEGWTLGPVEMLPWRLPGMLAALAAGAMLGMAGTVVQRLTGNPMASPEVLGINAGAALGLLAVVLLAGPAAAQGLRLGAGTLGALATLGLILLLGRGSGFAPDRLLLAGIALGAGFDAVIVALLAVGHPQAFALLTWMAGSTYAVTLSDAAMAGTAAVLLCPLALLAARWLDILPLGEATAQGLGIGLGRSRGALLVVVAGLTAAATLVVGPLSFVGLMAPHVARFLGLRRAVPQLIAAALFGALVMVVADWLGRTLLFPRQVPAGLLATLVSGPFLFWRLRRL